MRCILVTVYYPIARVIAASMGSKIQKYRILLTGILTEPKQSNDAMYRKRFKFGFSTTTM